MNALDLEAIAWFEDLYQKLEANTVPIYQDSIKYVENQVETVGACVEKFYADLVQNTFPMLSKDLVGPESPRSQSVHCADNGTVDKSELDINEKHVTVGDESLSSDSYPGSGLDEHINDRVSSGSCGLCNLCEQLPHESNTVPINEDSIKHVENQAVTVGACVEKFCADLVQNALPLLSNDPFGPESHRLQSLHCADNGTVDRSELDINEKQVTDGDESLSSDSYSGSESDEYIDARVSFGSCDLSHSCEQLPQESNNVPIYEDSIKYVENQAETVGAYVEKFCADLVQNALPLLSNDPFGPESHRLQSLHCADNGTVDKSELDINEKQVTGGDESLSSDSYSGSELDEYINYRVSSGSCALPRESTAEVLTLCNKDNSEDQSLHSQKLVLKATPLDTDCTTGEGKLCTVDECVASTSTVSSSLSPTVGDDFGNGEDMSRTPYGISYEQVRDEIEQKLDEIKLDESCVLVDKHDHLSVSHLDGKQGSYKKKIRNMLYPRRWSRSKNQKQLNTWNEHTDTNDSPLESYKTELQSNSLESGWEFV